MKSLIVPSLSLLVSVSCATPSATRIPFWLPSYVTSEKGECLVNREGIRNPGDIRPIFFERTVICDTDGDGNLDRIDYRLYKLPFFTIYMDNVSGDVKKMHWHFSLDPNNNCIDGIYEKVKSPERRNFMNDEECLSPPGGWNAAQSFASTAREVFNLRHSLPRAEKR